MSVKFPFFGGGVLGGGGGSADFIFMGTRIFLTLFASVKLPSRGSRHWAAMKMVKQQQVS